MSFVLLLLASLTHSDDRLKHHADEVDLIEFNSYYDDSGKLLMKQIIFWSLDPGMAYDKKVIEWWTDDKDESTHRWAIDYKNKIFFGRSPRTGKYHKVKFKRHKETWTQFDPELHNKSVFPDEDRRTLGGHIGNMLEPVWFGG